MHKISGHKKVINKEEKLSQKLSTAKIHLKRGKNKVIHEVIHVIHIFYPQKSGLHSKKTECLFCVEIIKFAIKWKTVENILTFQIWKKMKTLRKMSDNSEKIYKKRKM